MTNFKVTSSCKVIHPWQAFNCPTRSATIVQICVKAASSYKGLSLWGCYKSLRRVSYKKYTSPTSLQGSYKVKSCLQVSISTTSIQGSFKVISNPQDYKSPTSCQGLQKLKRLNISFKFWQFPTRLKNLLQTLKEFYQVIFLQHVYKCSAKLQAYYRII